jgi:hypothetical protein
MVDLSGNVVPTIPGMCGVCKRELTGDGVLMCSRCRAFYHPECWTYNGARCAIYGCGNHKEPSQSQPSQHRPTEATPEVGQPVSAREVVPQPSTPVPQQSAENQQDLETLPSFARGLAGLAVLGGVIQACIVGSFLLNGGSLERPLYVNPIRTILDLFMGAYPALWLSSLSSELRHARKLVVYVGAIAVVVWGLGILGRVVSATTENQGRSFIGRYENKKRDVSPDDPPSTGLEGHATPHTAPTRLPEFSELPTLPQLCTLPGLSREEQWRVEEISLSQFRWKPIPRGSLDSEDLAAEKSGYTHWIEFYLENKSPDYDATNIVVRLRFDDWRGNVVGTPTLNALRNVGSPVLPLPGDSHSTLPKNAYLYFRIPVVAPAFAWTCGIGIAKVEGTARKKAR